MAEAISDPEFCSALILYGGRDYVFNIILFGLPARYLVAWLGAPQHCHSFYYPVVTFSESDVGLYEFIEREAFF